MKINKAIYVFYVELENGKSFARITECSTNKRDREIYYYAKAISERENSEIYRDFYKRLDK